MQIFTREQGKHLRMFIKLSVFSRIRQLLMLFLFTTVIHGATAQQPPACAVITTNDCSGTLTACVNSTISYTANVVFYGGATYAWDFPVNTSGATIVSGQGTTNVVVNVGNVAGQYILRMTMVNPFGTTTCSISLTVVQLTSNVSFTPVTCAGGTSSLTVTASGGIEPYTYNLQPGNITNGTGIFTGLTPDTYTVTITNGPTGCSITNTVVIPGPSSSLNLTETHTSISCGTGTTGTIDLSVSGGTAPYNYLWVATNGGVIPAGQSNLQDLTGLVPGSYTVLVTDAAGCSSSLTVNISSPSQFALDITHLNISCFGNANGMIDLTVIAGTPPFSYTWTATAGGLIPAGQANNQDLVGIRAGIYSVVVTDAGGCIANASVTVTQPSLPLAATSVPTNVMCTGANGAINLSVTGGTAPYTYFWISPMGSGTIPPGQEFNQDLTGLTSGTYTVTVTDVNGCTISHTVTLTVLPSQVATSATVTNVSCFGTATGVIDLTVTGGVTPYSYVWTGFAGGIVPTGQANSQDLAGLVAGMYTVMVTDANGCTSSRTVTVSQPVSGMVVSETHQHVLCSGGSTGSIDITVTNGGTTHTYVWTATGGGIVPIAQVNNQDLNNIVAGTYTVTVSGSGCSATTTIIITQPSSINSTAVITNEGCIPATGAIDLSVTGGTPPYSYNWATSGGSIPTGQSSNQDLTGLIPGIYTVTITDANNCVTTLTRTIAHVCGGPTVCDGFTTSVTQVNPGCDINSLGSINLSVIGGTAPFSYFWTASNGGIIPAGQTSNQDLTGLVPGEYHVVVSDANSCTTIRTVIITQSSTISATSNVTNVLCKGGNTGAIDLTIVGAVAGVTYSWTATSGGLVPGGQINSQDLSGIRAGVYTVVISGSNCGNTTLTITVTEPTELTATTSHLNAGCGNTTGSIDLSVSGGTPPYNYLWTASSGGTVPPAQVNNQDLSGLHPGTYHVVITDANGCTKTKSVIITASGGLSSTYTVTNVSCYNGQDGQIDLTVPGNIAVTYTWVASNGGYVPSGQLHNQDLTGIKAGTYTVIIISTGCGISTQTIHVSAPPKLEATTTNVHVLCTASSGSINLTVSGGTPPYSYNWIASNGGIIPAGQAGNQDLSGLIAGTYTVTITDANGCTKSKTAYINLLNSNIHISAYTTKAACAGSPTGAINISVSSGTPPYTYNWTATNGGSVPVAQINNEDLTGISAGTYHVLVTDANGCTKTKTQRVENENPISAHTSQQNVSSCGGTNGSINLSVSGGSHPYTYLWTATNGGVVPTGQSGNQDLTGLTAGTYTVLISSASGCTATRTVVITQNCNGTGNYGCDYKYWREHTNHWNQTTDFVVSQMPAGMQFTTSTNFYTYFNIPQGSGGLPSNLNMQAALYLSGGDCKNFSKYAVSALLTVASGQTITWPTGTNSFGTLYTAIRTALLNSNCGNPLRNQLKDIKHACNNHGSEDPGDGDDDDDDDDDRQPVTRVDINTFPNPYTDQVTFRINSEISGDATLELYGLKGEKITVLYKGPVYRKIEKSIIYRSNPASRKTMVYRLTIGNVIKTGKVLYIH